MSGEAPKPPKLFLVPKDASHKARIISLPHPRTAAAKRYYFCPEKGIHEIIRITASRSTCRSLLLSSDYRTCPDNVEQTRNSDGFMSGTGGSAKPVVDYKTFEASTKPLSDGYVIKDAEILVATPMDLLFLLLPSLSTSKSSTIFQSVDDILEELCLTVPHCKLIVDNEHIRNTMMGRLQMICDFVKAGDEKMFRLNKELLFGELMSKARRMVSLGLPASLEEKFIKRPLQVPSIGLKSLEVSSTRSSEQDSIEGSFASTETMDSQSSASTTTLSTVPSLSTLATSPEDTQSGVFSADLPHLLRLRTAFAFISASYLPITLSAAMGALLASSPNIEHFKSLDEHLEYLARMRQEALASRTFSDFSRKRSMNEDDEIAETRVESKRKKEEEEKRKRAGVSRSIRDLKKADISGMKKLSDFFCRGQASKK